MRFLIVTLAVVFYASTVARADEPPRSANSSGDADVGRVFMSPAERQELDRLRKVIPAHSAARGSQPGSQTSTAGSANNKARPAGYIVPSSGTPYKWLDGDFQKTTRRDIDSGQLPGGVSIIRHRGSATDAGRTNPSDEGTNRKTGVETVSESETGHDDIN